MSTLFSRLLVVVALMMNLGVWGCASGPAPVLPGTEGAAVSIPGDTAYLLGSGDKLRVTTFGEPTLTGEFTVGGNGVVSLPLVGDISAQGATVAQFRDRFVEALKNGYLVDPRVSVEVLTYRPFYVLGEVNRPGEYPYTNSLTVQNAVATAGGFTYRANTRRVFIKRQGEIGEREYRLTVGTMVAPGDTIRIGERFF